MHLNVEHMQSIFNAPKAKPKPPKQKVKAKPKPSTQAQQPSQAQTQPKSKGKKGKSENEYLGKQFLPCRVFCSLISCIHARFVALLMPTTNNPPFMQFIARSPLCTFDILLFDLCTLCSTVQRMAQELTSGF
jgi:hypothetical protein